MYILLKNSKWEHANLYFSQKLFYVTDVKTKDLLYEQHRCVGVSMSVWETYFIFHACKER